MSVSRQIYESLPDVISIPPEWRRRRVEVIILPLDEGEPVNGETGGTDDDVARFFGSIPDLPEREQQGEMRAQITHYIEELKKMSAQMAKDREEGERLKAETQELRARLPRAG